VFQESSAHCGTPAETMDAVAHAPAESMQVVGGCIGQGGGIEVGPQLLDGIEVRRVRRQPLDGQPRSRADEQFVDRATAVGRQPIPHENHAAPRMAAQCCEEPDHVRAAHGAGMNRQGPAGRTTGGRRQQGSDRGEMLPMIERLDDNRGPAPRRPRRADRRPLGEAALVQEAQYGPQASGVFFTLGQVVRIQRATASGSRSFACRAGRWRLHPNWRKSRHACGTE
jgi:hypothetical protein